MTRTRSLAAALILTGLLASPAAAQEAAPQPQPAAEPGDPAEDFLRVALQFCLQSLGEPETIVAKLTQAGATEMGPGNWSEGTRRFGARLNGRPFDVIASKSGACAAAAPQIDALDMAPEVGEILDGIEGVECREAWGKSDPDYGPSQVIGRRFCAWRAGETQARTEGGEGGGLPVLWLQYTQEAGEKGLAVAEFGALTPDMVQARLESDKLFQEMWRK